MFSCNNCNDSQICLKFHISITRNTKWWHPHEYSEGSTFLFVSFPLRGMCLKNAGLWRFKDLKGGEKCSCVHWTGHGETGVRNQNFHWWSLLKLLCMLRNGAILLSVFAQIDILERDIILRPLDLGRSIRIILCDAPLLNSSVRATYIIYIMKFV